VRQLWRAYAALSAVAVVGYFALPAGRVADLLYSAVGLSCVAAILVGIRLHRPSTATPWLLMAAGQAAWVAGDVIFSELEGSGQTPFPSVADVAYLSSYPLLAAGIVLLIRAQRRPRDLAGLVDSLIVAAGFGLLSWAFVAGPIVDDQAWTGLAEIVALAYPAADILLLALLLRLVTGQRTWSPSFVLLTAAAATLVTADTAFAASSGDTYVIGLDGLWLVSYVLWGAAALHPDVARLTQPALHGRTPFTAGRLAVLAGVVLLPLVLLVGRAVLAVEVDAGTLVAGSAVLSLLVMARMACDIDEIRATARQRDDLRDDLFRRATQDQVTGFANRPSMLQQITSALERGVRGGSPSAVMDVQLHGVTTILHEMGFARRDDVLRVVARRLEDVLGAEHAIARIGSAEFVVLVERLRPDTDLAELARSVIDAIDEPLEIEDATVALTAAIGIAVSLDGGVDADALLHQARMAATAAATGGHEPVEFFDGALRREQAERLEVEAGLAEALAAGHLEVYYQPVVAVETQVLDGFEALLRWNRPGRGVQLPDSFIPIAEKSDLVCELDRWVLREATRQMVAWTTEDPLGSGDLNIAVNISGRHFESATIYADVTEALRVSGLPAERLTLEVTETVLLDVPRANPQLTALRELGVSISIDDFGTGFTSIGQLGSLPADILKIDRSLVTSTLPGAAELLALIVQAGHACGLLVVAEGVEDAGQLAGLRDLRYDLAQGYLFARPGAASVSHPPELRLVRSQETEADPR